MSTATIAIIGTLALFGMLSYALVLSIADGRIRRWASMSARNHPEHTRRIALARVRERRLRPAWYILAGFAVATALYLLAALTVVLGRMV